MSSTGIAKDAKPSPFVLSVTYRLCNVQYTAIHLFAVWQTNVLETTGKDTED
jgi:hypothetical protein